jgi:hypothetical protein
MWSMSEMSKCCWKRNVLRGLNEYMYMLLHEGRLAGVP